jgi:hypothetical protein
MYWKHAIGVAVVLGAMAGGAPLAAQATASTETAAVQTADTADMSWPAIVPRLATYTAEQKASITAVVQQYCAQTRWPDRAELQARISALLTPEQALEAVRYWIPQDMQHDLGNVERDLRKVMASYRLPQERVHTRASRRVDPTLEACGTRKVPA